MFFFVLVALAQDTLFHSGFVRSQLYVKNTLCAFLCIDFNMSGSPLTLAMQVPLPQDGSVTPLIDSLPATHATSSTRAVSGPTLTTMGRTLQHGSSEQVQAQIDRVVDHALYPHTTMMPNPMGLVPAPRAARGRTTERTSEIRTEERSNMFGGRMLHTEQTVGRHSAELVEIDTKIIAIQTDISLVKLHLQHTRVEDSTRDNVSQSVEQRIAALEQLVRTEQLKSQAAEPAAASPIDPLQANDSWAHFLAKTSPPGLGQTGNPAPPAQTSPAISSGTTSNTVSTVAGFIEARWNIDRKVSKELRAFDDKWENYEGWYSRIREHAAQGNQLYLRIFDLIEATPRPIRMEELADLKVEGLPVDWRWIAVKLWTFIGDHVTDLIHSRRIQ